MGELSANLTLEKTSGSCVVQQKRPVEKAFNQDLFQDSARAKRDAFVAGAITMPRWLLNFSRWLILNKNHSQVNSVSSGVG